MFETLSCFSASMGIGRMYIGLTEAQQQKTAQLRKTWSRISWNSKKVARLERWHNELKLQEDNKAKVLN